MEPSGTYYKVVSLLLQYPEAELAGELRGLADAVEAGGPAGGREAVRSFLGAFAEADPIGWQERYTAVFDLSPPTGLHMAYHAWGDGEKRAGALAELATLYRDAGFETVDGALPDELPLILEFLSERPRFAEAGPIRRCLAALETLVERLAGVWPPYGGLLKPLADAFAMPPEGAGRTSNPAERRFRPEGGAGDPPPGRPRRSS
jgi:nitrate reductase delta subunit